MSCDHLPSEQIAQLVMAAITAAADRDGGATADVVRPIYEGSVIDGWLFLGGILGATETLMGGRDTRHTALRFCQVDSSGQVRTVEPDAAPPELVAYGRLLTAYLNRDQATATALWSAAVRAGIGWSVIALALFQAGQLVRAGAR